MKAFYLDGFRIFPDTPFFHDGVNYPANWLTLASPEDRAAVGITEVEYETRPDDRYYYVVDNGDGTYTATPRDLDQIKESETLRAKTTAYSYLAPSDWYVTRKAEYGTEIPPEVVTYRGDVRASCTEIENQIAAATSIEEIQSVEWLWPEMLPLVASR